MAEGIFDYVQANGALNTMKRVYQAGEPMGQFPEETYYLKEQKKTRKGFGVGLYDEIQTKQNMSFGQRNNGSTDNEDLPNNAQPEFESVNWNTSRGYMKLTVTGKVANRLGTGDSFLKGISWMRADIENAWKKDLEFRCLNTPSATGNYLGLRGVLDNTGYTAGSTVTFTLDVATNATFRRYKLFQGIQDNMELDVYNGTSKVATITGVRSIDVAASTFVGDLSVDIPATASTFYLYNQGSFNQDLNGLGGIIDDGTYTTSLGGLTTSPPWESYSLGNSGTLRDFAPAQMDELSLRGIKANGGKAVHSWMSFGMKQQLMAYAQRVVAINTTAGSKSPFKVNPSGDIEQWGPNATMKTSAFMPAHEIFLIQKDGIIIEEQQPLMPVTVGVNGSSENFWQRLPGKDTWEAVLVHDVQQRTRRRNVHFRYVDLNQPSF